jgi:Sensors of blue-light using FAD
MIRRFAYISRPADKLPHAEIPRIVSVSRSRNTAEDITGILLFTGLHFVQVIEGEPLQVAKLWTRIGEDARHHDVIVIVDERDNARWFSDWRIGFSSDSALAGRVEAWHQVGSGRWTAAARDELHRVLAAADSL